MKIIKPQKLTPPLARLGEGPVWDDRRECLWWIDIQGCAIHRFDPATGMDLKHPVSSRIGMLVLNESGDVLAALEDGLYWINDDGSETLFARNPQADEPRMRFNDGKCDRNGRLWIGTMELKGERGRGNLWRVDPDGTFTCVIPHTSISNGLAWNKADDALFFSDTASGEFARFDYDPATGSISNRRVLIDFTELDGGFDGLTIDENDDLWVARWDGSAVSCYDSETGEEKARAEFSVPRPSCPAFGGKNRATLFVTTAVGDFGSAKDDALGREFPDSGSLYAVETGSRGVKTARFAGKRQ